MVERLSPDDTRILRLESDVIAGHTLKLVLVDPPDDGEPMTLDLVRRRVASRLAGHRRARQRLASTPMNLATPAWIDDTSFDIRHHVRLASEPVDNRADLIAYAGKAMAERLDHLRPLWCMDFAGPLDNGRTALVIRIHHCMADGVTALRMLSQLLWDDESGPDPNEVTPWEARPEPGTSRLLAAGVAAAVGRNGPRAPGAARDASPRALAARGRHGLRSAHRRRPGAGLHVVRARGPQARRARGGRARDRERRRPGDGRGCDPALALDP